MRSLQATKTADQERAIESLRKIFDATGPRTAAETYSEAVKERLEKDWMRSEGVQRARGRICVHRLTGKKCTHSNCTPPGTDHASLWIKDGNPTYLVSQPYSFGMGMSEHVNEYCRKHGLTYQLVSHTSFYYPGASLMVVFWLDETARTNI